MADKRPLPPVPNRPPKDAAKDKEVKAKEEAADAESSRLSGFKSRYHSKKQALLVRIGAAEETVDPDFEDTKALLMAYERRIQIVMQEARTYLTAVRTLAAASRKMVDSLVDSIEPETRMRLTVLKCNSGQDAMDRQVNETIDPAIMQALDGFNLFAQKFADYSKRMKDRQAKLLEFDRLQAAYSNMKAKPPADPTKLPQARDKMEKSREIYQLTNEELISDMKSFLAKKMDELNPHFRDLCFAHTEFFTAYASELSEAYKYCPEPEDL